MEKQNFWQKLWRITLDIFLVLLKETIYFCPFNTVLVYKRICSLEINFFQALLRGLNRSFLEIRLLPLCHWALQRASTDQLGKPLSTKAVLHNICYISLSTNTTLLHVFIKKCLPREPRLCRPRPATFVSLQRLNLQFSAMVGLIHRLHASIGRPVVHPCSIYMGR